MRKIKSFFHGELGRDIFDLAKDLSVIVIIVIVIRSFIIMPFQISGSSMADSYYDREFIIVDRLSYIVGSVDRGDVVVFRPGVSKAKEYFIKRVIGLPGDTIKIEDGKVYLSQKGEDTFIELNEGYLSPLTLGSTFVSGKRDSFIYDVPEGSYFVMGDNRNHSTDSRECFSSCVGASRTNFIEKKDIIGKLFIDLGYFSFSTFSFKHPELGIDTMPKWFKSNATREY